MQLRNVRPEVLKAVSQAPVVARGTRRVAGRIRDDARRRAPKDTGAGARSIKVVATRDRGTGQAGFKVTWTRDRFYMRFYENGATRSNGRPIRAQHFLREAAQDAK